MNAAIAWDRFDILGNVLEWVSDGYHPDYVGAPSDGQSWNADGQRLSNGRTVRILRGGAWYLYPNGARAAFRFRYDPAVRHYGFGVRLARSIPTTDPTDSDVKTTEVVGDNAGETVFDRVLIESLVHGGHAVTWKPHYWLETRVLQYLRIQDLSCIQRAQP